MRGNQQGDQKCLEMKTALHGNKCFENSEVSVGERTLHSRTWVITALVHGLAFFYTAPSTRLAALLAWIASLPPKVY